MDRLRQFASPLGIIALTALMSGCAGGTVLINPMDDPLPLSPDPVLMEVECTAGSRLSTCSVYYPSGTNHGFNATVKVGEALTAYVENVIQHGFDATDDCRSDSTPIANQKGKLTAELVFITSNWSGGWSQTTETIVRWTLADESGREIWSDDFSGIARGALGIAISYKGSLRRRHEQSLAELYEATVKGITGDPIIRLYSYCSPFLEADDSLHVDIATSILERRSGCQDLPAVRQAMLMFAAQEGNLPLTKLLLASGANLNEPWKYMDTTPLGIALASGRIDTAAGLVELGADVDFADQENRSLLFVAALREDQDALEFLAGKHAAFTPVDTCGYGAKASALAFRSLAEAAASFGNREKESELNRMAVESFTNAAKQFDGLASKYHREKSSASFRELLSGALKQTVQSAAVVGRQYQARTDARRQAEFKALRSAGSHDEYFATVNEYRRRELASMDSQGRMSAINAELRHQQGPEVALSRVKNEDDLQGLIDYYQSLAEQCRDAAESIAGGQLQESSSPDSQDG